MPRPPTPAVPPRPIETDGPPPKRRTESDETTALRALRTFRLIDERLKAAKDRYEQSVSALSAEKTAITATLTPAVAKLVNMLQGAPPQGVES